MNARRERMKLILLGALIIIAVYNTGMLVAWRYVKPQFFKADY